MFVIYSLLFLLLFVVFTFIQYFILFSFLRRFFSDPDVSLKLHRIFTKIEK